MGITNLDELDVTTIKAGAIQIQNSDNSFYTGLVTQANGLYVKDHLGSLTGPLIANINLSAVFNIKSYGALGNGATDDSASIQSAINAAQTNGGVVYFPVGTYLVGTSPTVSTGKIILAGDGADSILKIKASTKANALLVTGTSYVQIKGLYIDGNLANVDTSGTAYTTICGIRVYNSTNVIIEDCCATNCYYGGIVLGNCTHVMVRNNRCFANRDNGIFLRPANTNVTVIGN